MKYDVFISYSSHDQKVVEGLCAYLESLKIRCFVAYRDIPKSVVWAKAIVEALEQSRMMVVVFSNHFNNSVQVDREIELASEDNKPILTFRITNDAFKGVKKYYLKNINWIDAFPNPAACFGKLADNIAKLLGIKLIAPQPQTPAPTTSPAAFTPTPAVKPSTVKRALELLKKSVLSILVIIGVAAVAGVIIDNMSSKEEPRPYTDEPIPMIEPEISENSKQQTEVSQIDNNEATVTSTEKSDSSKSTTSTKTENTTKRVTQSSSTTQKTTQTTFKSQSSTQTTTKSTTSTPTKSLTSAPYKVGDYYNDGVKEGVVFGVTADGKSGKIVSMTESTESLPWSSDSAEQKRLIGADSETDGVYNMAKVKAIYGWQSKYPAFKWCADLGEGWYLPAKEELLTIYKYKDKLNPKLTDKLSVSWYWSSTEYNYQSSFGRFCAWLVAVGSGSPDYDYKYDYYYVRAVSSFGDSSKTLSAVTTVSNRKTSALYKVGDYYNENGKEGVVFEVSADGRSGKIVSMKQSAERLQWSFDEAEQNRLIGANSETDGAYNMAVVKAIPGWETKYPAFKWCADLGKGWYLPSIEELKVFTLNEAVHDAVNRTLIARGGTRLYDKGESRWYWSSTEDDYKSSSGGFCAWGVNMNDGHTYIGDRSIDSSVRAVSAF